jgi:pimeloyl-ACP methyl ester carboxylesterase
MVAYAFAAKYPESTEKLVIMDAFIPGVGPGDQIYNSPDIWHFRFHGPYAEKLVKGRERIYFDSLWDGFAAHPPVIPEEQKVYYTQQYARSGRMRAGSAWFEAFPQDAKDNKILSQTKLTMPLLSIGGEKANGAALAETAKVISDKPSIVIVKDCGHWMIEECQKETLKALTNFL